MSLQDFIVHQKLGEGAYSEVNRVVRKVDGLEYALKKVKISNLNEKERENALNEVRLLASIKHTNVIAYREAIYDEATKCLCIVMEYADDGDVFQLISECKRKKEYLPEDKIWHIAVQALRGLKQLHRCQVLHRDMKSANIFLFKNGQVKLGDMNVSKVAKRGMLYTQTGTPYYASPEVWKEKPYNSKSDVWSLGCVLFEMCALKPPFRSEDMEGLYRKVIKGKVPGIPSCFSKQLYSLITQMLIVNPDYRPSCKQILESEIVLSHPVPLESSQFQSNLLNTIRVPINLHYLTDVMPRPNYLSEPKLDKRSSKLLPKLRRGKQTDMRSSQRQNTYKKIQSDQNIDYSERDQFGRESNDRAFGPEHKLSKVISQQKLAHDRLMKQRRKKLKQQILQKKIEIQILYGKRNASKLIGQGQEGDKGRPSMLPRLGK